MSYISLYRKYRPSTFDTIVGQDSVTKILKNQIKSDKISHAYIFSGSRGTGKTSAAKVFSRAINCLNPRDGEPCNECEVCKNILEGNTTDVIEMDAASNNSVENIRQIRQEVVYATIDVKYRVYIIDEAHMLTTSAFNALLKTLEEPPENVVFILATTEQHKIPVTILSRCLRFEFRRISDDAIIKRLNYVLEQENIKFEDEAISYIAKLADGGLRDALSILERCISEYSDILKKSDVERIVGAINTDLVNNIADSIINFDAIKAVEYVDNVIQSGKDLRQLVSEVTEEFLNRLLKNNDKKDDNKRIISIIDRLSKLDNDLRLSTNPEIVVKACFVELCNNVTSIISNNGNNNDNSELISYMQNLNNKIIELENKIKSGVVVKSNATKVPVKSKSDDANIDVSPEKITSQKSSFSKFAEFDGLKNAIAEKGKLKLYSALASSELYIADILSVIITNNSFAYNILKSDDNAQIISSVLSEKYGINNRLLFELNEKNEDTMSKLEQLLVENNIEYTNIDCKKD